MAKNKQDKTQEDLKRAAVIAWIHGPCWTLVGLTDKGDGVYKISA